MPTRNRRRFVGQAIWYFLRQDYPRRELVIVDDGEDAVADLVPSDERIRYTRLDQRMLLGAKRNLACELSRGDLIAHWDDDDWMAPQRLSTQVAQLLGSGAEVCGARELLHYRPEAGEAWLYRSSESSRPWLAGCTLLYSRSAWSAHRFPELSVGEDGAFLCQFPSDRLHALADTSLYVALIHSGNTGAKHLADPRWERRPLDEVSLLLALDRDFYVGLRANGHIPHLLARPQARRPAVSSVTVGAPFMVYDGYGSMAEYLVLGMTRAGATVNVVPLSLDTDGLSAEFQQVLRRSHTEPGAPVLYFCWPRLDLERFRGTSELFVNTMWESSRLPADWPDRLNQARAVIVPTRFVAHVCRESGVTAPIEIVPEGVDPEVYHYEERPPRESFTALVVGTVVQRKHTREAIAAWKLAFPDDPMARLIIKSRFRYGNYVSDDPRIRLVDSNEATRGIAHWYRQADVLLALGSEGFGLPLVEGMATGLPAIALTSEGQRDTCEGARGCLLPVEPARWEVCEDAPFGRCGVRGVPDVEQVAAHLRSVASHRDEARAMGKAASEWVEHHRNIWAKAPSVLSVMERYTQPARPLRRTRTFWTPSWQSPCGIAEFTARLAEALPYVRVVAKAPDMRGVRLLHIQHEDSLFNDAELSRRVQEARQAGVPVVVTEHSVRPGVRAWERDADALVALTQAGAKALHVRWPTKRVECIPHGCPTWFPARKTSRGRVIAAFGFLEQYKGFWRLLDALRELPGAELLLFSHAKSAEQDARWEQAADGLPVRRFREFLPADEIARRIAAEADALVFWYDHVASISASGAARIGLATGVPILASPTAWFSELREVTHQPSDLLEGIREILEDTPLRERLSAAARDYCHEHSWPRIAERHLALWRTLDTT